MVVGSSDQAVSQVAQAALSASHRYELRQLQVVISDEGIVVSGKVSSYFAKQQAQETIRAVVEDVPVINQVSVE